MRVNVKILAPLKKPFSGDSAEIELREGSTVLDLLIKLGYSERHIATIMSIVDGETKQHDYTLKQGQLIELFILMGGG
jgi:sulfur carrier protein ThiS